MIWKIQFFQKLGSRKSNFMDSYFRFHSILSYLRYALVAPHILLVALVRSLATAQSAAHFSLPIVGFQIVLHLRHFISLQSMTKDCYHPIYEKNENDRN